MTKEMEVLRKCDKCEYFEVSPGGCVEKCNALRIDPRLTKGYVDDRINAEKLMCKSFRKLTS